MLFFSKINLEINLTYKCIKIWSQLNRHLPQWRIQGGGAGGASVRFSDNFFFLQKRSLLAKISINEYEICLKILEMVILETQIFKFFGGACPIPPQEACAFDAPWYPPPILFKIQDPPLCPYQSLTLWRHCIQYLHMPVLSNFM